MEIGKSDRIRTCLTRGTAVPGARRLLLATTLLLAMAACNGAPEPPPSRPNVLLISLDTLRADHLGAYGYPRPTSPFLDSLAAVGVRFADVMTPSTTTRLAHRAILKGLPAAAGKEQGDPLATLLKSAGYATAAFVDGGFMRARFGHGKGFDLYVDDLAEAAPEGARPVADRRGGGFEAILPRARQWLDSAAATPWFLFLHTYDIHCPYQPPQEDARPFTGGRGAPLDASGLCGKEDLTGMDLTGDQLAWIRDLYDGGIHHADRLLGEFMGDLADRGMLDNTVVAVIADHGESLGEGGIFGHNLLRREQMFVPWILSGAGVPAGRVVEGPAHLEDLVPTLLDYAGVPRGRRTAGYSLRAVVAGEEALPEDRLRVCETRDARALVRGPWWLVMAGDDGRVIHFGRLDGTLAPEVDEQKKEDIRGDLLDGWQTLVERLDLPATGPDEADIPGAGAVRRELRSLGYVE
ncbi:MAG: sulfatase [Acidobacteria bacterium]|nr:sulfatase [Acidobacteriota bacterium]